MSSTELQQREPPFPTARAIRSGRVRRMKPEEPQVVPPAWAENAWEFVRVACRAALCPDCRSPADEGALGLEWAVAEYLRTLGKAPRDGALKDDLLQAVARVHLRLHRQGVPAWLVPYFGRHVDRLAGEIAADCNRCRRRGWVVDERPDAPERRTLTGAIDLAAAARAKLARTTVPAFRTGPRAYLDVILRRAHLDVCLGARNTPPDLPSGDAADGTTESATVTAPDDTRPVRPGDLKEPVALRSRVIAEACREQVEQCAACCRAGDGRDERARRLENAVLRRLDRAKAADLDDAYVARSVRNTHAELFHSDGRAETFVAAPENEFRAFSPDDPEPDPDALPSVRRALRGLPAADRAVLAVAMAAHHKGAPAAIRSILGLRSAGQAEDRLRRARRNLARCLAGIEPEAAAAAPDLLLQPEDDETRRLLLAAARVVAPAAVAPLLSGLPDGAEVQASRDRATEEAEAIRRHHAALLADDER